MGEADFAELARYYLDARSLKGRDRTPPRTDVRGFFEYLQFRCAEPRVLHKFPFRCDLRTGLNRFGYLLRESDRFQEFAVVANAFSQRFHVEFGFGAGGDAGGCHRG